MSALRITVTDARPAEHTASPAVVFRLHVEAAGGRTHVLALRCQVRIEPQRRRYTPEEQARLYELFGTPAQWSRTLRPLTWAQASVVAPSFEGSVDISLPVACTYDLEVGSAKYLHALRGGTIPLVFLFTGTVYGLEQGSLQVTPVSWDLEADYAMPASVWQAAMDQFFPGGGWLRVSRETIDRLQAFRGRHAVVSWDEALDRLLTGAEAAAAAGTGSPVP